MSFWFMFMCALQCGVIANTVEEQSETDYVTLGSDVSLSCKMSDLPETSTVWWEREGAPTANTTLFYNNTAFLLLHTVTHDSQGKYLCKSEGRQVHRYINVSQKTYEKIHILYRVDNSEVSLICKSKNNYTTAIWKLESSQRDIARGENGGNIVKIKNTRFSVPVYDGFFFPLHIKAVMFNDSGEYGCYVKGDRKVFTTIWLRTLRVSAEPPGGAFRNRPVVLTCEVSEVTDHVTLAWLSMEGGRGVLVKQEVLTKSSNKTLSITVDSVSEEKHLWQCAVFTGKNLSALVPITLTAPTQTPSSEEGGRLMSLVAMVSAGVLGVCILVAVLAFYRIKSTTAGGMPPLDRRGRHSAQSDATPENVTDSRIDRGAEVIYSTVSVTGPQHDPSRQSKKTTSSDKDIIYSTIKMS